MRREELYSNDTPTPSPLPAGYTRLNYLECTGTQYINTLVYINPNFKLYLEGEFMSFNNGGTDALAGGEDWPNNNIIIRIAADNRNAGNGMFVGLNICYGDLPNSYTAYNIRDYQSMLGKHAYYMENGHQHIDDVERIQGVMTKTTNRCTMYFFASNTDGSTAQYKCKRARFYYSWIKNGVTLVREFLPALRVSDSKPGLYDTVNDVFYTNQGTGEFNYA